LNYKEEAVNLNRSPFFERLSTSVCSFAKSVSGLQCLFWPRFRGTNLGHEGSKK
jgi:hypothetical protein